MILKFHHYKRKSERAKEIFFAFVYQRYKNNNKKAQNGSKRIYFFFRKIALKELAIILKTK